MFSATFHAIELLRIFSQHENIELHELGLTLTNILTRHIWHIFSFDNALHGVSLSDGLLFMR